MKNAVGQRFLTWRGREGTNCWVFSELRIFHASSHKTRMTAGLLRLLCKEVPCLAEPGTQDTLIQLLYQLALQNVWSPGTRPQNTPVETLVSLSVLFPVCRDDTRHHTLSHARRTHVASSGTCRTHSFLLSRGGQSRTGQCLPSFWFCLLDLVFQREDSWRSKKLSPGSEQ